MIKTMIPILKSILISNNSMNPGSALQPFLPQWAPSCTHGWSRPLGWLFSKLTEMLACNWSQKSPDHEKRWEKWVDGKWQPCALILVSNHCSCHLHKEKSALPNHCEVFGYQALVQDRLLVVEAPVDVFENIGATVSVFFNAFFDWFTQFKIAAPIRRISNPPTQCFSTSSYDSDARWLNTSVKKPNFETGVKPLHILVTRKKLFKLCSL